MKYKKNSRIITEPFTPNMYKQKKAIKEFLCRINLTSVNEIQKNTITSHITAWKLDAAISRLKANKSPGSDGYPSEWDNVFQNELIALLLPCYNCILSEAVLPPLWKEVSITLLPKDGMDKTDCKNYSLIALLNVD